MSLARCLFLPLRLSASLCLSDPFLPLCFSVCSLCVRVPVNPCVSFCVSFCRFLCLSAAPSVSLSVRRYFSVSHSGCEPVDVDCIVWLMVQVCWCLFLVFSSVSLNASGQTSIALLELLRHALPTLTHLVPQVPNECAIFLLVTRVCHVLGVRPPLPLAPRAGTRIFSSVVMMWLL